MIILGIDPGTLIMGYGIIESREEKVIPIKYGTVKTAERSPTGERLSYLYNQLVQIISEFNPDAVAIEEPFVAKNVRSALAIGKAQAVAILAAANLHKPCYEYSPAEIKQRVTNYGASSKDQIQQMVRLLLGLDEVPAPSDAADALAVALCHLQSIHLNQILNWQVEK